MVAIHLFANDASGLALLEGLPPQDDACAVIVPANRLGTEKVERLTDETRVLGLPLLVHPRGGPLPANLPPAGAAISWLYSQLLAAPDLRRYADGLLNMHGGRIPEYRGESVLLWAIANGERELGITWHEIVEEVDAGAIWDETTIPIPGNASAADMRQAMIAVGVARFPLAWQRFRERRERPRYPDREKGRIWPRFKNADRHIEPAWPAEQVRNLVRACGAPWPPATIEVEGRRYAVAAVLDASASETLPYPTADGTTLHLLARQLEVQV